MYAFGLISLPPTAFAQATRPRTVTVPEAVFLASEKAIAERDALRTIVALKDDQLKEKDNQIAALNGLLGIERGRADNWAKAALERKEAIVFDDKAAKLQEVDNLRLRAERDSARRGQRAWGLGGLIIGAILGVLSQR